MPLTTAQRLDSHVSGRLSPEERHPAKGVRVNPKELGE